MRLPLAATFIKRLLLKLAMLVVPRVVLYFCCHGGDAAHVGVSHDDYVDIRLAWFLVFVLFSVLIILSVSVPWPTNDNDDFFE